uniref:Uncharacterized protein n=1 Tax=Leersia perrieri TaxID=77586 RepID=A0A0D9WMN3_9ORYZ
MAAAGVRTGVPDGASDRVAPLEEELDDPRPNEHTGAGHAHRLPVPQLRRRRRRRDAIVHAGHGSTLLHELRVRDKTRSGCTDERR